MDLEENEMNELDVLIELSRHKLENVKNVEKSMFDDLKQRGLVKEDLSLTEAGYAYLEPYRVKRAILIAAGFGSRMVPLTYETPKPLIKVHGRRIIETLLDALLAAGIEEIIICRGYLKETFDVLKEKYPMIQFIDNPDYDSCNNISSVYYCREYLSQAYVLESDLFLYNPDLIRPYEYKTNYLSKPVEKTVDWCFDVKGDIIQSVSIGGENCEQMYGISFWEEKDAIQLAKDVKEVFESSDGKQLYWDEVTLKVHPEHYTLSVRRVQEGDIIEIDTYDELKAIDQSYV